MKRRIASIVSLGLIALASLVTVGAESASADPGYVQQVSASFKTLEFGGRADTCTAKVWLGQTTTGYIEGTGTISCTSRHAYVETDQRIKASAGTVGWITRNKNVCSDLVSGRCTYEYSASSTRATRGRTYCGELFAYSMPSTVVHSGHKVVCFTAR